MELNRDRLDTQIPWVCQVQPMTAYQHTYRGHEINSRDAYWWVNGHKFGTLRNVIDWIDGLEDDDVPASNTA